MLTVERLSPVVCLLDALLCLHIYKHDSESVSPGDVFARSKYCISHALYAHAFMLLFVLETLLCLYVKDANVDE